MHTIRAHLHMSYSFSDFLQDARALRARHVQALCLVLERNDPPARLGVQVAVVLPNGQQDPRGLASVEEAVQQLLPDVAIQLLHLRRLAEKELYILTLQDVQYVLLSLRSVHSCCYRRHGHGTVLTLMHATLRSLGCEIETRPSSVRSSLGSCKDATCALAAQELLDKLLLACVRLQRALRSKNLLTRTGFVRSPDRLPTA